MWPSYGIYPTLYREIFLLAILGDISQAIQTDNSCGHITGYFSRHTEECFVWPSYGIFPTLYREIFLLAILGDISEAIQTLMFHVATLRDISKAIQNNASCGYSKGYVLTFVGAYYQS